MDQTVQHAHYHEVIRWMVHEVEPGPSDHGSVVVEVKEGDLVVFLAEYEEDCV